MLEKLTGIHVRWECALEVEFDKRKREWLKLFTVPDILCADVSEVGEGDGTCWNLMTDEEAQLPEDLAVYSFGYSCKDLSTLNNMSSEWRSECVVTGRGSTGKTWLGNMGILRKCKPMLIIMENVPSARRGANHAKMVSDLAAAGYRLFDVEANSADYGLPQDRRRAWFVAILDGLCLLQSNADFQCLMDTLKLDDHLPLARFLLPPGHSYLKALLEIKKKLIMKREQAKARRGKATLVRGKATAKATTKVRAGNKWKSDHWMVRRVLGMPAPSSDLPDAFADVVRDNAMCDRESDLFRVICDGPAKPDPDEQPCVELKHSAPRVVGLTGSSKRRRRIGSTSCLLPTSKLMLLPPLVPQPRYLTGLEALGIQGVDAAFCSTDAKLTDSEYMHLAGNAFSGACFAAAFISAMSSMDVSKL